MRFPDSNTGLYEGRWVRTLAGRLGKVKKTSTQGEFATVAFGKTQKLYHASEREISHSFAGGSERAAHA